MRLLVCGDRDWDDPVLLSEAISIFHPDQIVEGEARGADKMAHEFGDQRLISVISYPAQWKSYGNSAGPIRNEQMLMEGNPDVVLAFHDHLSESKGTRHMVSIATRANKPVYLVTHDRPIPANLSGIPRMHPEIVHCKQAHYDKLIDRQTKWGNPFKIGMPYTRLEAILEYGKWLPSQTNLLSALPELQDKILGCWCRPHLCHGDMIEEFIKGHITIDSPCLKGVRI